jgi:hypothetical protein
MTLDEGKQKFDQRWTVLGGAVTVCSSVALLQLSASSITFVALSVTAIASAGFLARRFISHTPSSRDTLIALRLRLALFMAMAPLSIRYQRTDRSALLIVATMLLWSVCVNLGLQIAVRYSVGKKTTLPYVQFVGDFWVALFLMLAGANWSVVAGGLVFYATTAQVINQERDSRLMVVTVIASASLLVMGSPTGIRAFTIYLFLVIVFTTWSADRLVTLAKHLRLVTVSASDGSAPR